MKVPLKEGTSPETAKHLAKTLTEVYLSQVLERVDIYEKVVAVAGTLHQRYRIRFQILPEQYFADKCNVSSNQILTYIEDIFINKLQNEFGKLRSAQTSKAAVENEASSKAVPEKPTAADSDDEDDDEVEVGSKRTQQSGEINSYEDDAEDENEAMEVDDVKQEVRK